MSRAALRRWLLLVAVALTLAVGGCVSLPAQGPVRTSAAQDQVDPQEQFDFNPAGPSSGASPVEVVDGFLSAMTATPLTTFVARQFLTSDAASSWVPEHGTVVYDSDTMGSSGSSPSQARVTLRLSSTTRLDARGEWLGDPSHGRGIRYHLRLVRENGEWRISNPPDRLVIPQSHFDTRYAQYFLYFFEKSAQVLVPEPVYLPGGAQTATLLVAGLLHGPDPRLRDVERTFIPTSTKLGDISVPVTHDGVADVPLSSEVLDLHDEDLSRAFAQLAWTLGQVPGVDRMRVSVDGSPVGLGGSSGDVSVNAGSDFDPAVAWASQSLFGLRKGRAVEISDNREQRVAGVFGSHDLGLRSIAADLPGTHLAGVSTDGSTVLVANSNAPGPAEGGSTGPSTVYTGGTDLLRPVWDLYGGLWLLDRTAHGAALTVVRKGAATAVQAPGITGQEVRRFVLSRDGTRLAAVLHVHGRDRLVIARVRRTEAGRVIGLSATRRLSLGAFQVDHIRDVAWRTPGSLAVLAGDSPSTAQVLIVTVDSSSALIDAAVDSQLFRSPAVSLATSPVVGAPLYVATAAGRLFELAGSGRWVGTTIAPGLRSPAFVG